MTTKYLFLVCFVFLSGTSVWAQRKVKEIDPQREEQKQADKEYERSNWREKWLFGGNAFAGFGSNYAMVFLQPQVGYIVNDNFLTGGGLTYSYVKQTYLANVGQTVSLSDHLYGINLYARHNIIKPVFAYADYGPMNFTSYNSFGDTKRVWGHSMFLGLGLNQSTDFAGAYIIVAYDVLWKQFYASPDPNDYATSIRNSPWDIRIGLLF